MSNINDEFFNKMIAKLLILDRVLDIKLIKKRQKMNEENTTNIYKNLQDEMLKLLAIVLSWSFLVYLV